MDTSGLQLPKSTKQQQDEWGTFDSAVLFTNEAKTELAQVQALLIAAQKTKELDHKQWYLRKLGTLLGAKATGVSRGMPPPEVGI